MFLSFFPFISFLLRITIRSSSSRYTAIWIGLIIIPSHSSFDGNLTWFYFTSDLIRCEHCIQSMRNSLLQIAWWCVSHDFSENMLHCFDEDNSLNDHVDMRWFFLVYQTSNLPEISHVHTVTMEIFFDAGTIRNTSVFAVRQEIIEDIRDSFGKKVVRDLCELQVLVWVRGEKKKRNKKWERWFGKLV